jgi:hypothetical protein
LYSNPSDYTDTGHYGSLAGFDEIN